MVDASTLTLRDTEAAAHAATRTRMLSEFECDTDAQLIHCMAQEIDRVRDLAQNHLRAWRRLAALKRRNGYEIPADMLPTRRRGRLW